MSSINVDYVAEHGLGPVESRVALSGRFGSGPGAASNAELILTPRGALVVAASTRFSGEVVSLADTRWVYRTNRLRDQLEVAGSTLMIAPGRSAEVRRILRLGRLREQHPRTALTKLPTHRLIQAGDATLAEYASALVGADDLLLGVAKVQESELSSEFGPATAAQTLLVLSAESTVIATWSELGDSREERVHPGDLRMLRDTNGVNLASVDSRYAVGWRQVPLVTELVELQGLLGPERVYEAARRSWLRDRAARQGPATLEWLAWASARGHAASLIARLLLFCEQGNLNAAKAELELGLAELERNRHEAARVELVLQRWEWAPATGMALVTLMSALGSPAEPWALELHRAVHAARASSNTASQDLALAEHELSRGHGDRARVLAEAQLTRLPMDESAVLTPERARPEHALRLRLHELRAEEAELRGQSDVGALVELARLEPLSLSRLRALANSTLVDEDAQSVSQRAVQALRLLSAGGLTALSPAPDAASIRPLDKLTLDTRIRHPLAQGSGRLATRLSELVASVPEPDLGFLREFCEGLVESRHPDAARALARATRLFGFHGIRAYVSHGTRSIGVRAFRSRPPFVIIGASHLEAEQAVALSGRELDFAFAAELAHLALGHERVTAGEIWLGAAGKTRDALQLLGFVAPVVAELGGPRAAMLLRRLNPQALDRAVNAAGKLERLLGKPRDQDSTIGQRNEELILAHRLVQLSADRAGLVASGSLHAALRALLRSRLDYQEALERSDREGLAAALDATAHQNPALADLRIRVRALVAFYLSADFMWLTSVGAGGAQLLSSTMPSESPALLLSAPPNE